MIAMILCLYFALLTLLCIAGPERILGPVSPGSIAALNASQCKVRFYLFSSFETLSRAQLNHSSMFVDCRNSGPRSQRAIKSQTDEAGLHENKGDFLMSIPPQPCDLLVLKL